MLSALRDSCLVSNDLVVGQSSQQFNQLRPLLAILGFVETDDDKFEHEAGYTSLFNGKDLTGWGFHAKAPATEPTFLNGMTKSPNGRYVALHGRLVVTTPAEGSRIQQLWTTKEFPSARKTKWPRRS